MLTSVCVNTYKRPDGIVNLLGDLAGQVCDPPILEVVVTDNDAKQSARANVENFAKTAPFKVIYQVEPQQNISLARNRGVHAASGGWIGMLDDDERVKPDWLHCMLAQAEKSDADGVFSIVIQNIPEDAPPWLPRGSSIYGHQRYPSGTIMPSDCLYSGNALVKREILLSRNGPYDPAFGLSGGEDVDLFMYLANKGAKFVWCDEAMATEDVPAERLTEEWYLKRVRRGAQDYVISRLTGRRGNVTPFTRVQIAADTGLKLGVATLSLALSQIVPGKRGVIARFTAKKTCVAQLGKFDVLRGRARIQEYTAAE